MHVSPILLLILCYAACIWGIAVENDTDDLCKVCNGRGGNCFTLSPHERKERSTTDKKVDRKSGDDRLTFQCASDKAGKDNQPEFDVREVLQGVIDLDENGEDTYRISKYLDSASGGNVFIHDMRNQHHRGSSEEERYEFDNKLEYEGKSGDDALLNVVHAKVKQAKPISDGAEL